MVCPAAHCAKEFAAIDTRAKHTGVTTIDTWYANPDFEAMRAFELSEVPDESIWRDFSDNNTSYRWNGGNLEAIANNFEGMLAYGKAHPPGEPNPVAARHGSLARNPGLRLGNCRWQVRAWSWVPY